MREHLIVRPKASGRGRRSGIFRPLDAQGEDEFLFSAYSAFEVVRVHWSATPQDKATPHEITLRAAPDNRCVHCAARA